MSTLVAIRTHRWGEDEERLCATLSSVPGLDLAVAFHNRAPGVEPPVPVADVTEKWARKSGLKTVGDWGWRCGDYFFYRLREVFPDHDHYWLIEPDVFFSGDPTSFFAAFEGVEADVLGLNPEPRPEGAVFGAAMEGMKLFRAIFALTRISGRALDTLFDLRREYSTTAPGARRFANDETFVYSHAMAREDMSVGDLAAHAPDWFAGSIFDTDPDMILEAVTGKWLIPGKLYHPVRGRASFKNAIANRLTNRVGWVSKIKASVDELSDADIDDIVASASDDLRRIFHGVRANPKLGAALADERNRLFELAAGTVGDVS